MMSAAKDSTPVKIFISYSHKDERLRERLDTHLKVLQRLGVISTWHDRRITGGREWAAQIDEHLNTAAVILLLVSADFMASDYCNDRELKRALERHNIGEARVIPVILRPVAWQGSPLARLQILPTDGRAVTDWPSRDRAFNNIAEGIREAVEEMQTETRLNGPPSHPGLAEQHQGGDPQTQDKIPYYAATLDSTKHTYVLREQDRALLKTLLEREYVNLIASRSMGKSSMIMRTILQLQSRNIDWVFIDLQGELGNPNHPDDYFIPFIGKLARKLAININSRSWWISLGDYSANQKILKFFCEFVAKSVANYVVVFLDEIETTKQLEYSSNLFFALKSMYNERPIVHEYRKIVFCLAGREIPSQFAKVYNIGQTIELDDFDPYRDDLSEIAQFLDSDLTRGKQLLDRVLFWTNGQPYLTAQIAARLGKRSVTRGDVDDFVVKNYQRVEIFADPHFHDIIEVLKNVTPENRNVQEFFLNVSDDVLKPLKPDHEKLRLLRMSGLVKRDNSGRLVVRNRIYAWIVDPSNRYEEVHALPVWAAQGGE